MTCSEAPLSLPLLPRKPVLVDFDGGDLSSDGGLAALALADQRLRLTDRLAAAVADPRDPRKVRHTLAALFKERVYLIGQGYADCNDANTLRHDPAVKLALGKEPQEAPLAGQSSLSRFENAVDGADLRRLGGVLLEVFVEQCGPAPRPRLCAGGLRSLRRPGARPAAPTRCRGSSTAITTITATCRSTSAARRMGVESM